MPTWEKVAYDPDDFANRRHIGPSPSEMEKMLGALGVDTLDQLIDQAVPGSLRQGEDLGWEPMTEGAVLDELRRIGSRNRVPGSPVGRAAPDEQTARQ